jgi:hypothetical protein
MPIPTKSVLLLALLTCSAAANAAQPPSAVPATPIPAQIVAARTIFISNASGETLSGTQASQPTYSGFYAAMKAWGRYQLAGSPTDADLIFEIRYGTELGPTHVLQGEGTTAIYPSVRLTVFDPKTHVILWAFSEAMVSTKDKSDQEHLTETLGNLLNDLKTLVSPVDRSAPAPTK